MLFINGQPANQRVLCIPMVQSKHKLKILLKLGNINKPITFYTFCRCTTCMGLIKLLCVLYVGGTIEFIEANPEVLWNRLLSNTNLHSLWPFLLYMRAW